MTDGRQLACNLMRTSTPFPQVAAGTKEALEERLHCNHQDQKAAGFDCLRCYSGAVTTLTQIQAVGLLKISSLLWIVYDVSDSLLSERGLSEHLWEIAIPELRTLVHPLLGFLPSEGGLSEDRLQAPML
jgi:hypothetical protein